MLVLSISEDLHELFKDRSLAPVAALGEFCGIVVMTVDHTIVLIVAVFSTESCWAN